MDADVPDPVIEAWFARARLPATDEATLERGRRLVATKLATPEALTSGPSLRRRLTWAAAGGGGLWASMVGAAAAHPIIGAVTALALVAGGATAVEISGVGPAARESVGLRTGDIDATLPQGASATAASMAPTAGLGASDGGGATSVSPAPESLPGNLLTQIHDGRFVLRAQLVAVGDGSLTLLTAAAEVTIPFADAADVHVPGKPDQRADLTSAVGRLAMVFGSCDEGVEDLGTGCVIERVQVLGAAPAGGATDAETEKNSGPSDGTPGAPQANDDQAPPKKDKDSEKEGHPGGKPSSAGESRSSPGAWEDSD